MREFANPISRATPLVEPGTAFTYSNIGAGIVCMVLTGAGSRSCDSMLGDCVSGERDLHDVTTMPDPDRVASGHDAAGWPGHIHAVVCDGCRCLWLYGTVSDLPVFLGAYWSTPPPAFLPASGPRVDGGDSHQIGQFWLVGHTPNGVEVRALGTPAPYPLYRSFMAVIPERQIAVAVLSNTARPVDRLGSELLDAALTS